ncbi:MAG: YdeI/OmpD-associated family protein [Deltaproteobacteria bacterium]
MPTKDPRVDAYIARAAPFARPVLSHLRSVVRAAVPEAEETIKWGMPHYVHHGILCCIAGFKGHCALHLRRGDELLGDAASDTAMGQFGRIRSLSDLPSKAVLVRLLRKAAALNQAGTVKPRAPRKPARPAPRVPGDLAAALKASAAAAAAFEGFSPSKRRDYVEWILEAKGKDTRAGRIATAVGWMAEGKARNWKYERC